MNNLMSFEQISIGSTWLLYICLFIFGLCCQIVLVKLKKLRLLIPILYFVLSIVGTTVWINGSHIQWQLRGISLALYFLFYMLIFNIPTFIYLLIFFKHKK